MDKKSKAAVKLHESPSIALLGWRATCRKRRLFVEEGISLFEKKETSEDSRKEFESPKQVEDPLRDPKGIYKYYVTNSDSLQYTAYGRTGENPYGFSPTEQHLGRHPRFDNVKPAQGPYRLEPRVVAETTTTLSTRTFSFPRRSRVSSSSQQNRPY